MDVWFIGMLILCVLWIGGIVALFTWRMPPSRNGDGRHDPSRAAWTSSAMQDAMDQGE
jgi:hypothetical protein